MNLSETAVVNILKELYSTHIKNQKEQDINVEVLNNGLSVKIYLNNRVANLSWTSYDKRDADLNSWLTINLPK